MAGLGAMFIGMITGGIAMMCMIVLVCIFAAVIFIDAYRHGMKAWLWALMALLFNFYSLPVYIYVRIKKATLKCSSCGTKVGKKMEFCTGCGAETPKFDDGAIAKKVIKYVLIAFVILSLIGGLYVTIVSELNP